MRKGRKIYRTTTTSMAASQINSVLSEMGMSALIRAFEQEDIDEEIAVSLTDSELARLGLETIGDRHRFRAKLKALGRVATVSNIHISNTSVTSCRPSRSCRSLLYL